MTGISVCNISTFSAWKTKKQIYTNFFLNKTQWKRTLKTLGNTGNLGKKMGNTGIDTLSAVGHLGPWCLSIFQMVIIIKCSWWHWIENSFSFPIAPSNWFFPFCWWIDAENFRVVHKFYESLQAIHTQGEGEVKLCLYFCIVCYVEKTQLNWEQFQFSYRSQ